MLKIEVFGYNITVFFLCLVSGVLIDIDHLVDFRLNRWHRHESIETQFERGRMYLPLHGIENTPILAVLSMVFSFLTFPTISYIVHMTLDIYSNDVSHKAYFYTIRLRKIMTRAHLRLRGKDFFLLYSSYEIERAFSDTQISHIPTDYGWRQGRQIAQQMATPNDPPDYPHGNRYRTVTSTRIPHP